MNKNNFYITSPIYYVNDVPHIGHAYTSLACDVLARAKRLSGFNVHFLTGTDEHGQKVEKSALGKNKNPQEFCDEISVKFRDLAEFMGFSNDDFIRTTEDRHKKTAQEFWKILQENGFIYKDVYEGWYAIRDEAFYGEDEIVDGKAPTGAEVVWQKEESYFFKLSAFEDQLLKFFDENPNFIQPDSKRNEVISFVKGGLRDLSISRTSFQWGIKVPDDEKHVMYVWLDALTNYLSALNFSKEDTSLYKNFWENGSQVHIVGKDILRFHCVYWPAFLMAANLPLPKQVYAHGWWTNEGQKISKSVGNVISPYEEAKWLTSFTYQEKKDGEKIDKNLDQDIAIDYLRYFLLKEVPFGNDGDYNRESLINRVNSELANNIGNLTQRSLSMIAKNCDGIVISSGSVFTLENEKIFAIKQDIENLAFNRALEKIINLADDANKYFNDNAPWVLKKEDKIEQMNQVLFDTAESVRIIATLLLPFIPNSAAKILDLLNINEDERDLLSLDRSLESGHKVNAPKIIFPNLRS
ncbi:MAG: methionyl-tRNA synthetase [Lentimonas sp.]|jgi:methionyl-tRNA synthetase